jgi:hypothetical protein
VVFRVRLAAGRCALAAEGELADAARELLRLGRLPCVAGAAQPQVVAYTSASKGGVCTQAHRQTARGARTQELSAGQTKRAPRRPGPRGLDGHRGGRAGRVQTGQPLAGEGGDRRTHLVNARFAYPRQAPTRTL